MPHEIINLTFLKVLYELENLSSDFPTKIRRKLLTNPELKSKLLAYVLNKVPNRHIVTDSEKVSSISAQFICFSVLEELQIEKSIKQGIYYILELEQENDYSFLEGCKNMNSIYLPSDWLDISNENK